MARIEDNGVVRNNYKPPVKPKVIPPKPELPKPAPVVNSTTKKTETQNIADQQKLRLNEKLERDNSALIGGTAGNTAAQFSLGEQNTRNTGVIKIKGGATTPSDFVNKVEADIKKLAPNSTLERRPPSNQPYYQQLWDKMYGSDTLAVVKSPENNLQPRTKGNDQGYRLFDQLKNNPNEVTINYEKNNAYAAPRSPDAFGGVTNPGKGSGVDVFYDPDLKAALPSRNSQGNLVNSPADSAIILGHELSHASHMQRGTVQNVKPISSYNQLSQIFGSQGKENVFSANGKNFVERNNTQIGLREEYRNVGFDGHSYGNEPTENSLRRQLGITDERISYQGQNSLQPISSTDALVQRNLTRAQTFGDNVVDGVKGSRNSALIGAGFGAVTALAQGKDTQGVLTDTAVGAGTGVTQEVIQKVVNGASSTTSGMTSSAFRAAATQVKGAAVAGAVINTGFAIYDNIDNLKNDATRSKAVGTIAGEAVVGAASGAAGAYTGALAGAAIGSIVPGVGTVIGGVVGFAVGAAAGYLADKGLRGLGVDTLVAKGVTAAYDGISNAASTVADGAKNLVGGAIHSLSSIFG
jgi:Effector protein